MKPKGKRMKKKMKRIYRQMNFILKNLLKLKQLWLKRRSKLSMNKISSLSFMKKTLLMSLKSCQSKM